jgi:ABC-type Fe3+/spermidine/putrescine transport system ATPase subunit
MGNGHIEQIGGRAEIFDKPSSGYVAKFLGINTFDGRAIKIQEGFLEIDVNGVKLYASALPSLVGKNVIVTLKTEDISISKSAEHLIKEVDNSIGGVVTEMVQMRSTAQITVDAGFLLKSRLSLGIIKDLGINLGDKIYVCFDADALNVFAENINE